MKISLLFQVLLLIGLFASCKPEKQIIKQALYTQQDTLNLGGHKFSKKEFKAIVDNFPRLYQDTVLHPDSLYKLEFSNPNFEIAYEQNVSFNCDAGKDRFFALYAHFLTIKNKGTRFEYLRKHFNKSYATINTIFERLSRGGTHYIHQSSCIPAYVEYNIHFINNSLRLPEFTKKTRADRYEFIGDLKSQIESESKMADISYEFENEKIADLIEKLNEEIVTDYVLFKSKEFIKPYLKDFKEIQK
jgi:hypothetical protein